jgi:hypothetical protein
MATNKARVWLADDRGAQHLADPPSDPIVKEWEGSTACGVEGLLRWITPENVDGGKACPACLPASGHTPQLEGDYPGPP